ncbi:MAG TPA: HlyD family efflux transporter periplasmic adaptor subunit [Lacipirellulaceae bacterium]|jgi:putative peptide zinc metalloprotease protein|nr:HlyD family efflux transporter periplasmic adaptor subunit [Lacipirellulaceae bacterium]
MVKPIASVDRLVGLRSRKDLLASSVGGEGASTWVVKDPLTLEHFQFSAEEYALLDWLRQPVTISELRRKFQHEFAPQTITPQAICDFLRRLHTAGLLVSDEVGQGRELLARRDRDLLRKVAFSWTGLLGIRFRGVDPDRFLAAVHDRCRWLFSPATLIAALLVVLYALSILFGHFEEFHSKLPGISALVDWRNLPWLLVAIGIAKVLHELGHALVCKHFGGEVREMGFMLLVFAPCLYCDVSDAWRLKSKWRRIAVSAAGVTVELVLAAAATIVWWNAQPGVVQLVALNIMVICTLNTLLVNGNPLMRYDGYYILSDLVEVPNLWQRSREAFRYFWSEWLMGQPTEEDPLLPAAQRPWLAAYASVSKVYLSMVCVMIVWGLAKTLSPYHLENLAYLAGVTVFGSALVGPAMGITELAKNPARRAEVRKGRMALLLAAGLAALVAVLAFPVDYNVSAPLVLMPADAARVYATVDGTLESMLPAGSTVVRGDTIGTLANAEMGLELTRLEGELSERRMKVEHLERLRGIDHEANDQLPTARTALADSERRLEERRSEAKRLTLTAPTDGVVISAPRVPKAASKEGRLPKWSGSLLEPETHGAHVEPGTLACLVGDPHQLAAVLFVDDANVKFLQPGQRAKLRIKQLPGQVIAGEVVEVSRHETKDEDRAKAMRADLSPLVAGLVAPGQEGAHYEVRVKLDDGAAAGLVIGGRGDAKVATERITLGRRLVRYLAQTFRLPM